MIRYYAFAGGAAVSCCYYAMSLPEFRCLWLRLRRLRHDAAPCCFHDAAIDDAADTS